MALGQNHEIHSRRFGRNLGVGLLLGFFVVLVLGITVVKVTRGDVTRAFNQPPAAMEPQMVTN